METNVGASGGELEDGADVGGSAAPTAGEAQRIGAAEFKALCLGLMDQVRERGAEYVITKRGRPIAKLVPITEDLQPFVGRSRGVITGTRDAVLGPVGADWEVDADL